MPITFACGCGKTLRVKDEHAGKWVRCPACKETALVPEAVPEPEFEPQFEVVEEPPPARPARVRAEPAPMKLDDEEPPPRPRSRPDQEYDGPKKKKKSKRSKPADEKPDHFGMERGVLNGGAAMGMLAMVGAVVWFVVGLMNDILFYYPPVLFIVGFIGFVRGLVGANND